MVLVMRWVPVPRISRGGGEEPVSISAMPRIHRLRPFGAACLAALAVALAGVASPAALALTITEIHYHPAGDAETARRREFIELYNEDVDPLDLSNCYFSEGVSIVIPEGIFLRGKAYLAVCADAAAVRARHGIENAIGDWDPDTTLDNGGERITLVQPGGGIIVSVRYNDRGRWPMGADGTGHTLGLVDPDTDPDDADNWRLSRELGGTPGKPNFAGLSPQDLEPAALINEGLLRTGGARWIEVFNPGTSPLDLSGYFITDDPELLSKAVVPTGTVLPRGGWVALEDTGLGLDFSFAGGIPGERVFVALVAPSGDRVIDAANFEGPILEASEARVPDGARSWQPAATPTREASNRVDVVQDIVINEINYHPMDADPGREFIEIFNRGAAAVDVSGFRLEGAVTYSIPQGTSIGPGQFLVVARDPSRVRQIHGLAENTVIGPEAGSEAQAAYGVLRDSGERITLADPRGNTVDTVRWSDGGEWPEWADGGGSTLELIDPFHDNDSPQAWDASDDSDKAETRTFDYSALQTAAPTGISQESEIQILACDSGIALVDDLTIPGEPKRETVMVEPFVQSGDELRYWKGSQAPPAAWTEIDFDDSGWTAGASPLGYGEIGLGTVIDDMRSNYWSLYVRKAFVVDDPSVVEELVLRVDYDDGFVAYLNGVEATRANLFGAPPAPETPAASGRESGEPLTLQLRASDLLRSGTNVLAIQVHNDRLNSPDLFLGVELFSGRTVEIPAGWNMVPGGDFEVPLDEAWILEGTHIESGRTETGAISGAGSLKVVTSGAGDQKANRIEREIPTGLTPGKSYRITLRARWVVGSAMLVTQGYNFCLGRSHALHVPENLGTPGRTNGVSFRQAEREGSVNLGPIIDLLEQSPALPRGGEPVTIRARIRDPDGVALAELRHAAGSPTRAFQGIPMSGPDSRGFFTAQVPGQPGGTVVIFEIVARDGGGRTGRYPLDHTRRTHPLLLDPEHPRPADFRWGIFGHRSAPAGTFPHIQIWMHLDNEAILGARPILSDHYLEGAVVDGLRKIQQGAGIRFQGSGITRGRWAKYRIRMPSDDPFRGRWHRFNLDVDGLVARDRIVNYLLRANGAPFITANYVSSSFNTRPQAVYEKKMPPGSEYISLWFEGEDDGDLFELDERSLYPDGGTALTRKNARWLYPPYPEEGAGQDKESYRHYFNRRTKRGLDDFTSLMAGARILDPGRTRDADFDEALDGLLELDTFLRVLSVRHNTGDFDCWGGIFGRSHYLYRSPVSGTWSLIPWDSDTTFGVDGRGVGTLPLPDSPLERFSIVNFPEVERLFNRPQVKRRHYALLQHLIDGPLSSAYLKPYLDLLASVGATADSLAVGRPGGYVDQRATLVRGWLNASVYPQVRLEITTNGGQPFSTASETASLAGRAPAGVTVLRAVVNGVPVANQEGVFSSSDFFGWSIADVPLGPGANEIAVAGLDLTGDVVDGDTITVTRIGSGSLFVRGDTDQDGQTVLTDAVVILIYLFQGGSLGCLDAGDIDDNGLLDITDPIRLLNYLFLGGDPLPAPFEEHGADPTADALDCLAG